MKEDIWTKDNLHNKKDESPNKKPNNYLPSMSLLVDEKPFTHINLEKDLDLKSKQLEEMMAKKGCDMKVVSATQGQVFTLFEIELLAGTTSSRVSELINLITKDKTVVRYHVVQLRTDDIGIAIPNNYREPVHIKTILESKEFIESQAQIPIAIGQDILGQPIIADLAKTSHILMGGTTGSGKSVFINSILMSLLFRFQPDELRLILVDPKMLELCLYEDIPHLLSPVITDMKEACNALHWCVAEMERRYKLIEAIGSKNISDFNEKVSLAIDTGTPIKAPLLTTNTLMSDVDTIELKSLPFIVFIIDEFSDSMMIMGKKIETLINLLGQKADVVGIYMIIATARPSSDVFTEQIKTAFPTRIAFQVSSKIDSRTIINQMGAEKLLGQGDMLFFPPNASQPQRIQAAFVSDKEVHTVVEELKNPGKTQYIDEITSGE